MSINLFEDNANGLDGTFISELHENRVFDIDLFEKMNENLTQSIDKQDISSLKYVFKVYEILNVYICSHFDKNDLYQIVNISDDELLGFRDEFSQNIIKQLN